MTTRKVFNTRTMAKVAILAAVSFLLMFIEFPLPVAPAFYKLDFSEVAVMIGGFALGPMAAVAIEGIKILLNVVFQGSSTAYVGEIANFIIGCAFCVPASIYYKKNKSKKGALIGLGIGSICMIIAGLLMNYFVLIPAYSVFFHLELDTIVSMGNAIFSIIHDKLTFVLFATTPFNLIKSILVSLMTLVLYKHISPILHK